jgi:Fe-S-cluster containining protein
LALEVDSSELDGKRFSCIPGCAYCCLCPPEISEIERGYFQKNHPEALEDVDGKHQLALQGGAGGCSLLSLRQCQDYGHRPFHCRAFPLRVHLSYRVQACANLSCRGIQENEGAPLSELLGQIISESQRELPAAAAAAAREWASFIGKCHKRGAPVELEASRKMAGTVIERWPSELGADREEVIELVSETLGTKELQELPVFVGRELDWKVFRVQDGMVRRYGLEENGAMLPKGEWPLRAIPLLSMDNAGLDAFREYMQLLNGRDNLAASAALVVRLTGFEDEFEEVYLDVLRDCALDLWWRASLLAFIGGASSLGPAEIKEGVVFCDADFLDMLGIGGML